MPKGIRFFALLLLITSLGACRNDVQTIDVASVALENASSLSVNPDLPTPSSPPREFFSMTTLYLGDKIIHVGHDLINQNYVVLPSPNIVEIKQVSFSEEKKSVTIQQYFPDLEEKILANFKIPMERLHFLYIQTYEIYDQNGKLLEKITNPPGVQFRPPQFYTFFVDKDVKMLNFVYGFVGRAGWSESGLSADIQGIYKDLRSIGVDRNSSIKIEVEAPTGLKSYEVLSSKENSRLGQILSDFQHIVAWGRAAQKEELISKIIDLKNFETIHIDLAKGVEDMRKYPHIFGDPLNPKYASVLKKLSTEKLTEKDLSGEDSGNGKFDLAGIFSLGGGGSSKSNSRMKDLVKFDMDGEFYVPKALNFVVRTDGSFDLMKNLVFQAYDNLEESFFRLGTGVSLSPVPQAPAPVITTPAVVPPPVKPTFKITSSNLSNALMDNINFECAGNSVLSGFTSGRIEPKNARYFQHECRELSYSDMPVLKHNCQYPQDGLDSDGSHYSPRYRSRGPHRGVTFQCSGQSFLAGHRSGGEAKKLNVINEYAYQCCDLAPAGYPPMKKKECTWSGWVNEGLFPFAYSCPANATLAGVQSEPVRVGGSGLGSGDVLGYTGLTQTDHRFNYLCCSYTMD